RRIQFRLDKSRIQRGRDANAQGDAHVGVLIAEGLQDIGQKAMQGGVHCAQPQLTRVFIGSHPIAQRIRILHQRRTALGQPLSRCGGPHAAALAHQQRHAQLFFQRAHLLGDGRRTQPKLARGFRHRAQLYDLQEMVQVADIHSTHFLLFNESNTTVLRDPVRTTMGDHAIPYHYSGKRKSQCPATPRSRHPAARRLPAPWAWQPCLARRHGPKAPARSCASWCPSRQAAATTCWPASSRTALRKPSSKKPSSRTSPARAATWASNKWCARRHRTACSCWAIRAPCPSTRRCTRISDSTRLPICNR